MIFSAAAFSQKLGGALAGGVMGWLLGSLGYQANQQQSAGSEFAIVLLMSLLPAAFAMLSVLVIYFYPLTASALQSIQQDLTLKRKELLNHGSR